MELRLKPKLRLKFKHGVLIFICLFLLCYGLIVPKEAISELLEPNQRHTLERLSFGVDSTQIKEVKTRGIEAYIQSQLNPIQIPESNKLNNYLAELKSIHQPIIEVQKEFYLNQKKLLNFQKLQQSQQFPQSPEQEIKIRQANMNLRVETGNEAAYANLARAIYSPRQLEEVMVDFWFNHFNVFGNKGSVSLWINDYENKIRANSLGNFRELLEVTASHPAMLIYLDNERNNGSNSAQKQKKTKGLNGLNENYARELMELHTMGVDGGYAEEDILELARIFSGWSIDYQGNEGVKDGFFFYSQSHDQGEKVFLGHKITPKTGAKGIEEGKEALDVLASHPATAKFISYKLAQYFVADQPPSSLVEKLAEKFTASNGNIKVVLDTLIHSPEFNDPQYYRQKFKTPYQFLVSLVRMSEIEQPDFKRLRAMSHNLSMPIHKCAPPTGYKNTQDAWLNPQATLQRIGFASAIARKSLNPDYPIQYQRLKANFGQLTERTEQVLAGSSPGMRTALILGSPEGMYR